MNETSAPIGARAVKLEIMTDRSSDRQTDRQGHREVLLPIILDRLYLDKTLRI